MQSYVGRVNMVNVIESERERERDRVGKNELIEMNRYVPEDYRSEDIPSDERSPGGLDSPKEPPPRKYIFP